MKKTISIKIAKSTSLKNKMAAAAAKAAELQDILTSPEVGLPIWQKAVYKKSIGGLAKAATFMEKVAHIREDHLQCVAKATHQQLGILDGIIDMLGEQSRQATSELAAKDGKTLKRAVELRATVAYHGWAIKYLTNKTAEAREEIREYMDGVVASEEVSDV